MIKHWYFAAKHYYKANKFKNTNNNNNNNETTRRRCIFIYNMATNVTQRFPKIDLCKNREIGSKIKGQRHLPEDQS